MGCSEQDWNHTENKGIDSSQTVPTPLVKKNGFICIGRAQFPLPPGCGPHRQPRSLTSLPSWLYLSASVGYYPHELLPGNDAELRGQQTEHKEGGGMAAGTLMAESSFATQWLCDVGQSPLSLWTCKRKVPSNCHPLWVSDCPRIH